MHVYRACSVVAAYRNWYPGGISVAMPPPWRVPERVACLAVYPGRVMVGGTGSLRKVSCTHMIGGMAVVSCKA